MNSKIGKLAFICAVGTTGVSSSIAAQSADEKRFQLVECVMPTVARKLGRNFTTAVRGGIETTSAEECENFGGSQIVMTALEGSFDAWRPEAERGNAAAQYRLGSILEQGIRNRPDIERAIGWYQKAEAQGNLSARASLIRLAQDGKWKPAAPELQRLMGASFSQGIEPIRAEAETLRDQLRAAQSALSESERNLATARAKPPTAATPNNDTVNALLAEVMRLRNVSETYQQRMTLVEKVSDRLRLQLALGAAAPAGGNALPSAEKVGELAIDIFDPPVPSTRGGVVSAAPVNGVVRIIGRVSSAAGVKAFTVNNTPHNIRSDGSFEVSRPVTRGNTAKVTLAATDGANRTRTAEFDIQATAAIAVPINQSLAPKKSGTQFAMVIGNNNYAKGWTPLETAVNDAKKIANVLQSQYGFNVKLMTDVTRADILTALHELRRTLKDTDDLVIFYAGHGQIDSVTDAAYWVPVDGDQRNTSNWIAASEITNMVKAMKAKSVLLISDSCYAGAFTYRTIPVVRQDIAAEQRPAALEQLRSRKSRMILTSGGNEPVSDSGGGGNSLFVGQLIPLLAENKAPLEASKVFSALAVRVHEAAKKLTRDRVSADYSNQVPYYAALEHAGHEMGDFVFVPSQ